MSVIIPDLDCPTVDRAVDAVYAQEGGPPAEIIVVGRDGPGRLRDDPRAHLQPTDGPRLPGAARNEGVAVAGGDILVFLDADCVPAAGWLRAHVARHEAGEAVVGGSVLWDARPYWRLVDNLSMFHEFSPWSPPGHRRYLPTLNLSVDRAAFEAVGPMDPDLPSGEDIDWTMRAGESGYRPYFEPAARLWHRPARQSAADAWRHAYASGRWMVGVRRRHADRYGVPTWMYRRAALLSLAPLIASHATWRIFRPGQPGARHPAALPAVYLTKLAWCLGAAHPAAMPWERRTAARAAGDGRA